MSRNCHSSISLSFARSAERLLRPANRHQEVSEELIKLAKEMSAATQRGVDLGLNEAEVAFYDALAANNSAVEAMGS